MQWSNVATGCIKENTMDSLKRGIFTSDRDLWRAFLAGEKNAFAHLFHLYADAMYAYGKKITPDAELVRDTIQDVFVKLYQNRTNLSETDYVKGYLLMAIKRTLLNKLQDRIMLSIDNEEDVRFEIELIAQQSSPDDESQYNDEDRRRLALALKTLTPRQREAIYLHYIQEIPLNKISELLEMNYQSTRNLLHRAMLKLRKSISISELKILLVLLQFLSR